MKFEDLSPELQEKAKACETVEELFALAKDEGIELSEEDLEGVSGGRWGKYCRTNAPKTEDDAPVE